MNQFIKNIKSSAAKYRTQLLVLALAFVSACSPVKEEKVRELIEKDLPPFVKIAELKLGGCVEQESPYSRDWYVEAPFEVKFEIVETTYDPGYKKFDWRKDGKVHFVRLNQKKGTLIDKKGVAKLYYRENGSGEISERLSVQVQNWKTSAMGKPAAEFSESGAELIVQGSDEDKAWKKGYNEMLSGFKSFFPGIWSDKDGVLIYGDNSEYYIVRFKDKSFVRRKWELKNDGIMLGRDGGGGQVASRIVRISDKEWVEQDVRISGFGSSPSYLDRDKLTLYQKQKNLQDRESASENIRKGIAHCKRGDVFQIVLSRRFIQRYEGDDFTLYRALRSINPSPYLFYFDFGGFRIFGSSPETHCKIEAGKATIDPIAGTTRRSGDKKTDAALTEALLADPKENAEHVMLVDLARNDLSRNCHDTHVEFYKQPQYYSHVIHLVSRVSGTLDKEADPIKTFIDTFPAGTLSGAPKVKAMQLISEIEPHNRGAYGGCIGFIGLNGDLNQAITIRTFVSRNNELWFQAGGGIVAKSDENNELQEVNNKLGALKKAILLAEKI